MILHAQHRQVVELFGFADEVVHCLAHISEDLLRFGCAVQVQRFDHSLRPEQLFSAVFFAQNIYIEQAAVFAPMEHERWLWEHRAMGWYRGTDYETLPLPENTEDGKKARGDLREQLRCHRLMLDGELTEERIREHWLSLPEEYQGKDWKPFNKLLDLLREFDGLRIYRLEGSES